jgi:hypothetical protein
VRYGWGRRGRKRVNISEGLEGGWCKWRRLLGESYNIERNTFMQAYWLDYSIICDFIGFFVFKQFLCVAIGIV